MEAPVLYVLAGPNGAGKSTFFEHVLRPVAPRLEFVNADEIERLAGLEAEAIHSYEAAARAAVRRAGLIEQRRSFITETVFSHPSKLDLLDSAIAAGYWVTLHVVLVPVATTIVRVAERAELGGHDVPEQKIRARFERLWDLVVAGVQRSTEATVWDNSQQLRPFDKVATFDHGRLVGAARWPEWTPAALRLLR